MIYKFSLAKNANTDDQKKLILENETNFLGDTRFKFINNHKGLRPGMMHVLLGTTGSGKTTLSRSILADLSKTNKVLVYSSEETLKQFQTQSGYADKINLKNIYFLHEKDVLSEHNNDVSSGDPLIKTLEWAIESHNPKIVFIDNITTSLFYDQNKNAIRVTSQLRDLMQKTNTAFFVIAHTASPIRDGCWFGANDMRGFRTIANLSEYLYCLFRTRTIVLGHEIASTFVHVDKSRMHSGVKEFYRLTYEIKEREYSCDDPANYKAVHEMLKGKK